MEAKELDKAICEAASDKKARDIVSMDMRELTPTCDYFVVCSANTATQVRAIADNIEEKLAEQGESFLHKEGYREGEWILMDYGDVVFHLFDRESRSFYDLERIWRDGKNIDPKFLQDF